MLNYILTEIYSKARPDRVPLLLKFFQTHDGGYGQGDEFLGLKVPDIRAIAKMYYKKVSLDEIKPLLTSKYHEHRLVALIILVYKMHSKSNNNETKSDIYDFYLQNRKYVNNRDLVDVTAPHIIGYYLLDQKDRKILYELAKSESLRDRRMAIVSTLWFIRKGQFEDTLSLSKKLLSDKHGLIHKAVGRMLREVGNRNKVVEEDFLSENIDKMPRVVLRYAIEKFSGEERKRYLGTKK